MIALIALLGCAGGGEDTAAPEDLATSLSALGPWGIGYNESEISYPDPDPTVDADRSMRLATWYPSSDDTSGDEVDYLGFMPGGEGVAMDAPAAEGPLPLAIFSHGHQGFAEAAAFLMEHLASHGWLVLAPEHTTDTTFDDPDRATAIYFQRPLDISATLDHVESSGQFELSGPVVALGHSFGGYTLFALAGASFDPQAIADCYEDDDDAGYCSTMRTEYEEILLAGFHEPRIDAHISMAAGDIGRFGGGVADVQAPVLLMNGSLDGDDAEAYWDALTGDPQHLRLTIEGGGHNTFTEFSDTFDVQEGQTLADEAWPPIVAYALAWARFHAGDASVEPVLSGEIDIAGAGAGTLIQP